MSNPEQVWKQELERFFHDRGTAISGTPTLLDHCVVSAKDPQIAAKPAFHEDFIDSLVHQMGVDESSSILEVGCASGYIACGLAPHVKHYTGIDLAEAPLLVARKMRLFNADFRQSAGTELPFADEQFDAALANDVFSNFPSFPDAEPLLTKMIRVVRHGGGVLAGSITDAAQADEFQQHVYAVNAELEQEYGPAPTPPEPPSNTSLIARIRHWIWRLPSPPTANAQVINYNFEKADFLAFGEKHGLATEINDVHRLNPYTGYRFNVVMTKPAA